MIIGDIETTEKIEYEDLLKNYYEKMKIIEEQDKEIERLNKKIEQYENPEDMTLMFMWCDEKAKDEIKRLNNIIEEYKNANEYHQNIIHELETMKQPNQLHSENVKLRAENNRLNNIIKHTDSWIDRTIEIIKQQPSEDDTWILERLNGIKQCLKG